METKRGRTKRRKTRNISAVARYGHEIAVDMTKRVMVLNCFEYLTAKDMKASSWHGSQVNSGKAEAMTSWMEALLVCCPSRRSKASVSIAAISSRAVMSEGVYGPVKSFSSR